MRALSPGALTVVAVLEETTAGGVCAHVERIAAAHCVTAGASEAALELQVLLKYGR